MRQARLAVAFGIFVLIGINLGGGGVLVPAQIADYGVDKTTFGTIFFASSLGYLVSSAANGALLHRFGVRAYVAGGAAVTLAAAAAIALRPAFVLFVALQWAILFCIVALEAGLNTYLSTLERATTLLNWLHAFFGVGAVIGPLVVGRLLSWGFAWTTFYVVLAVLVVPLVAGLLVLYPRSAAGGPPVERPRLSAGLGHPAVWLGGLFLALYVGVEISVGNWSATFLTEERGQSIVLASWAVSGFWAGLTAGRFVLSRLAERLGVGEVGLISGCLAGTAVLALVIWLLPGVAVVGLALLGFCLGPMYPTMIAVVPRLVSAGLVATAIGLVVSMSVAGGALFPFLAGFFGQRLGAWSLFPLSLALTAQVGLVWWLIARRLAPVPAAAAERPVPVEPHP